jgi:hypothetical protein
MSSTKPRYRHHDQPGVFIGHWAAHDIYLTGQKPPQVILRSGDDIFAYKQPAQSIELDSASFAASAGSMVIEADPTVPGWTEFMREIKSRWPACEVQPIDERGRMRVHVP